MKKAIKSAKAPKAIGPYNQAVLCKGILFVSGQLPINQNSEIPLTVAQQTEQVLKNLGHVLDEAGYGYDDVVKTTCYLSDMDDFKEMNQVYGNYFKEVPPARATVAVRTLPLEVLVEIECIAIKPI
ncbi:Rid family detoxifying hydrolase [Allomuricauda sp. CP2A]|jgi:2-iminobutanoate/2-iminopropanoate deaminase|uniref:Rid family detoxifying hydrolase n=1 Tax=Allomuricauda sp. CP2A TaxID=1848189 RepID=UPI0008338710|nr:Rid family detoxifying hydrolase [Muricauda sp. CP2A]